MRAAGVLEQQPGFQSRAGQFHVNDVDLHDHGLAGVKAAFEDREAGQLRRRDVQDVKNGRWQRVVGVRKREFDFGQSQHKGPVRGLWLSSRSGYFKGRRLACRRAFRPQAQAGKKPSTDR